MMRGGPNPFTKIPGIRERHRTDYNAGIVVRLLRYVSGTRDHDLVGWPNLRTNELSLVANEETEVLHVLPLLPPSRDDVPLRGSANYDISLLEKTKVGASLPGQADDLLASLNPTKLGPPLSQTEVNHILIGFDTNRTLTLWLTPQSHQRKFRTNCLSATSGSTDKDVIVGGVQRLEDLCLDLVERSDCGRVNGLEFLIMQGGNGKVLEVEERGRWRELFWEDEMFEGNRNTGFRVQPSVGDNGDKVIGWNGLKHWNGDRDVVFRLCVLLSKEECIVEEDYFAIDVLDENGE